MERLCERPGCSEPASVAYGMVPEDLVFWLDAVAVTPGLGVGMLCRRHADSMVVPRGWTLDDRREPDLRLFRPPSAEDVVRPRRSRRDGPVPDGEQLRLDDVPPPPPSPPSRSPAGPPPAPPTPGEDTGGDRSPDEGGEGDEPDVWTPSFDADDDLDGLLAAKSPLLSRAFRGDGRHRS